MTEIPARREIKETVYCFCGARHILEPERKNGGSTGLESQKILSGASAVMESESLSVMRFSLRGSFSVCG